MVQRIRFAASLSLIVLAVALAGCTGHQNSDEQRQREEKTREEAQAAAERAKPEIQAAGRAIGRAAETAAEDARAAAQGVAEGWKQGSHKPLDLNSATEADLESLPGITQRDARKIIQHRPYGTKEELISKRVLSESTYDKIRDDITTK